MLKSFALVMSMVASVGAGAQSCGARQAGNASERRANVNANVNMNENANADVSNSVPPSAPDATQGGGALKVLAEGQYGKAERAFVAVVRDAETYASLRELAGELPRADAELFKTHAVVAAFLGERNTGGYGVSVTAGAGGRLRVAEKAPPADAMLAQVITNPFIVVSVPEDERTIVSLELGDGWKKSLSSYGVKEGEFTMSGGFAGRVEKFGLAGEVQATGLGKLQTFFLNLRSTGASKDRILRTTATGVAIRGDVYRLARLDAGGLVDPPNSGLTATAVLSRQNAELVMTFEPRPPEVSDGFEGAGRLKATLSRSAP